MEILRSPDDAVDGLPGYATERRWVRVPAGDGQTLRVHLCDVGPADAPAVVFLHGNPSWSWIWREQIDAVVGAGYRAVALDLVGMGMYDKPSQLEDYTVAFTQLLPTRPDNPMYPANHEAWTVLDGWAKPVLTIFSDKDLVAPHGWKDVVARIPGAKDQPHVILESGGHFLQEEIGEAYTETLMSWLGPAAALHRVDRRANLSGQGER